jgi:hypothetical protein
MLSLVNAPERTSRSANQKDLTPCRRVIFRARKLTLQWLSRTLEERRVQKISFLCGFRSFKFKVRNALSSSWSSNCTYVSTFRSSESCERICVCWRPRSIQRRISSLMSPKLTRMCLGHGGLLYRSMMLPFFELSVRNMTS